MLYSAFNKKINPKGKLLWVLFSIISATALAFTLVVATKIKQTGVESDVVAFHQMSVVFVVCLVTDIVTMKANISEDMEVKASGGIKTLEDAEAMIKAGATRIGASSGVKIVEDYLNKNQGGLE